VVPTKFRFIWLSGYRGEDPNVKILKRRTRDDERHVMATANMAFQHIYQINSCNDVIIYKICPVL